MIKKRALIISLIVSLFILYIILLFVLYANRDSSQITGKVISDSSLGNPSSVENSNYQQDNSLNNSPTDENFYWGHMPLTYIYKTINSNDCENCSLICAESQKEKIKKAFDQITEETNNFVLFEEINDNADIDIYCYGDKYSGEGDLLTLGEGEYSYEGNKILSAKLNFYGQNSLGKDSNCLELILHETFHILGFKHAEQGIMKPISITKMSGNYKCQYKIDEYITNNLKETYGKEQ